MAESDQAVVDGRHPWLRVPDALALSGFAAIAVAVTGIALVESYTNLYEFFIAHGLRGWRASIAPGCVDAFIVMGELLLFAAFVRSWKLRDGAWLGWLMAVAGFSVSVAGNVEHSVWASLADKATSAIFPVTAAAGLAGGLVIVKRVTDGYRAAASVPEPQARPLRPARKTGPARKQRTVSHLVPPGVPEQTVRDAMLAGHLTERTLAAAVQQAGYPKFTRWQATKALKAVQANGHGPG